MRIRCLAVRNMQEWLKTSQWLNGRGHSTESVEDAVKNIIENVRLKGDAALIEYTRAFDSPDFTPPLRVSGQEIARSAAIVPTENRENIIAAAANIRSFHEEQKEKSFFLTRPDGSILGQRIVPVDTVGLYVPGGQGGNTPLISTLLMNAIPAQVAGVRRLIVCTPPREDGSVNPNILAAAHLLDIDEVYRVGGAWSIAAMAYGTESIEPVDVIAGPGNIYVSTAKRIVHGQVGIDMLAGPSEVLILADCSARIPWLAADLLAQAEHDPLASAICITDDKRIAEELTLEVEKQCRSLPRAAIASQSVEDWGAVIYVPEMRLGISIANRIAPEHLEICTRDPWSIMPLIRNAGAIFMGAGSPEPVGDYFAGPNHVLPTMGTARFASALSVQTFCKKSSILAMSPAFLATNASIIANLARMEGLEAHARSVEQRSHKI